MALKTIKIFIASSAELKADREDFRTFISNQNDRLSQQGIYLQVVQWENFIDAISNTRLQDEYNKAMRECDIALCLFFTKVGKYTAEEFDTAYQVFKETGKPKIWTYFKNAAVDTGSITEEINTLFAFKKKIGEMGHFYTGYTNIDNLINQFRNQLDKVLPQMVQGVESIPVTANDNISKAEAPVRNAFNEILIRGLMESIKKYHPVAKSFSDQASRIPEWEKQERAADMAKKILASAYVGVLGIQLRKLIAIGKGEFSKTKLKTYIDNCNLTAKRALQLVSFAFLSALWDYKKALQNNDRYEAYTSEQADTFAGFFSLTEQELPGYVRILRTLWEIFTEKRIAYPVVEFREVPLDLQEEGDFSKACAKLHNLFLLSELSIEGLSIEDCIEAEKSLASVLQSFNFLVNYKMIAVKSIAYFEMRNQVPHYLHSYTSLDIDFKSDAVNQELAKYEKAPLITDGVLLYKADYRQNLNLFPFK
jgi:hypothetical protein